MKTIKEIKKSLSIKNKDISKMFGYKNPMCYANSTRKKRIEQGIIELFELIEKAKLWIKQ